MSISISQQTLAKFIPTLILCITLLTLFYLRVHLLQQAALFDYDSVRNFQIIRDISEGNLSEVFHHASPSFFLIYALIYLLFPSYLALEYSSALLNLLALYLFFSPFKKSLETWKFSILLLFIGTSTFMIQSSRYIAIESMSLLLFMLQIQLLHHFFYQDRKKYWFYFCLLFAFSITVNYKFFILLAPLSLCIFLYKREWVGWQQVISFAFSISLPFIFFSLFALFVLNSPLLYLKYFYNVVIVKDVNPNETVSLFNWDLLYYLKYILRFENGIIIVGLMIWVWQHQKLFNQYYQNKIFKEDQLTAYTFLFIFFSLCLFIGMAFLQKAPRGLLWTYPILYWMTFLILNKVLKNNLLFLGIFVLLICFNIFQVFNNVYAYSKTEYADVVEFIHEHQIKKLGLIVGNGVIPFLPRDVEIKVVLTKTDFKEAQESGISHFIVSATDVINNHQFDNLQTLDTLIQLRETSLLSPLIFIESSEYAGLNYEQTMENWKNSTKKKYNFILLKVTNRTD